MLTDCTGSSGALSSQSPPALRGYPSTQRSAPGPVPAISPCWGFIFSSPVSPLPSPGTCKHRERAPCLHRRGSASPCSCRGDADGAARLPRDLGRFWGWVRGAQEEPSSPGMFLSLLG